MADRGEAALEGGAAVERREGGEIGGDRRWSAGSGAQPAARHQSAKCAQSAA
jgi:hypothetical protein